MLKYWLAILLVLNAAVLAWQWDAFARWGHGPNLQREPERLQQQVRPDALKFEVLPPVSPSAEPAAVEANGQASALPQSADAASPTPAVPAPASAAPLTAPPAAPR